MGKPHSPVELELRLVHVGSWKGSAGTAQLHLVAGEGRFVPRVHAHEVTGNRYVCAHRRDQGHTRNMTASVNGYHAVWFFVSSCLLITKTREGGEQIEIFQIYFEQETTSQGRTPAASIRL